jgi:hypothetical protein
VLPIFVATRNFLFISDWKDEWEIFSLHPFECFMLDVATEHFFEVKGTFLTGS